MKAGLILTIPAEDEAILEDLIPLAVVPSQGITIKDNGVALNTLIGMIDVVGATVEQVSPGFARLTFEGAASALNDLTDVTLTSPASNDFLQYNGSAWVNSPISISEVASLQAALDALTAGIGGKQNLDATLTALAGLSTANNQLIYSTGVDAFAMSDLSPFARTLLDDADAATMRSTLGISGGGGANQALSNLTDPTAINQHLLFGDSIDLGSRVAAPREIYAGRADEVKSQGFYLMPYFLTSNQKLYLGLSNDGKTFSRIGPVYSPAVLRDPSIIRWNERYWCVYSLGFSVAEFGLAASDDLINWTFVQNVSAGSDPNWAPHWFIDDDGPHVFVAEGNPDHQIYELHPTNAAMTTWSSPVQVTGVGLPADMIDPFVIKKDGQYHLWFKNDDTDFIEYASSSSLTSGYTLTESGNWAGWGSGFEAPHLVQLDSGTWRIYFDQFEALGIWYSESTDWETWSAKALITIDSSTTISHPGVIKISDVATMRNALVGWHQTAKYPKTDLINTFTASHNIFTRLSAEAQQNRAAFRFNDGVGNTGVGESSDRSLTFHSDNGTEGFRMNNAGLEVNQNYSLSFVNPGVAFLARMFSLSTNAIRVGSGGSGAAGNFLIGASGVSIGTSGLGVLALGNATAPSSSPADEVQLYAKDFASGDSRFYVRSETGNTVAIGNGAIAVNEVKVLGSQQSFIADPSGGATQDAEARTAIVAILDALITHGLIASS